MFRNTLTGLSKRGKEVMDQVCAHLNGLMRKMGLKYLDGEEDQILLDLWMDTFPYKVDENGNYIMRTVRKKVVEVEPIVCGMKVVTRHGVKVEVPNIVGGRKVIKIVEERVREIDYTHSLIESTSIGIYKWRAEQLFLNKVRYLYGDKRVRAKEWDSDKSKFVPKTECVMDAWGNSRKHAVWDDVNSAKVGKRDLSMTVTESDLSRDGEDPITLADVAPSVDGGFEEALLMYDVSRVCNPVEMKVVRKFMDGDSTNQIFKDFESEGIKFSARQMSNLKEKLRGLFSKFEVLQ